MAAEDLTWPPQATAQDHLAVAALWSSMEELLGGQESSDKLMRLLAGMLPSLASVPARELPGIARIHLQSASHIKATMRLLAPEAFAGSSHDMEPTAESYAVQIADRLPAAAAPLVTKLIDLQVFHLMRVQEVVAHMRMHARQAQQGTGADGIADAVAALRAAAEAMLAPAGPGCMRVSASSGSGS